MVPLASKETIIWRLLVQSWLQVSNNTGILITCTRLWPTESEQANPVDSIKDVVRSSVKVPEFDKNLKKAGRHIGRNVVEITIKMKTIVRKPLMIKMNSCVLLSAMAISLDLILQSVLEKENSELKPINSRLKKLIWSWILSEAKRPEKCKQVWIERIFSYKTLFFKSPSLAMHFAKKSRYQVIE